MAGVAQGGAEVAASQPGRIRTKSNERTKLGAWAESANYMWKWRKWNRN